MRQSPTIFSPFLLAGALSLGACVVVEDKRATTPTRSGTAAQPEGTPARGQPAYSDPVNPEPAYSDPVSVEPAYSDPVSVEPASSDPVDANPGGSLTVRNLSEVIINRIRDKYRAGIQRCHQRALKVDPMADGSLIIRFTVGPTGRVTKANVEGFNATIDACIEDRAAKWRFGAPKKDGQPTSVDIELPLLLKPGS